MTLPGENLLVYWNVSNVVVVFTIGRELSWISAKNGVAVELAVVFLVLTPLTRTVKGPLAGNSLMLEMVRMFAAAE